MLHKRCSPPPPFSKLGQSSQPAILVLTHCPPRTANSRLALPDTSQFHSCCKSSYQQPTGRSKVTSVSSRMSQQRMSQFHGGQAKQSGDHSLRGRVPVAWEGDLSESPAGNILNSLSGWNTQEALEELIIHSLALLPMDLCFLVPIPRSVFVLTVTGDVCASFDGSGGQAVSSICSTHSSSTTHQSACQTQLSSEALMAAPWTKQLDSFQGSVHHQQPSQEAADTCFVITLQHWSGLYCSADNTFGPPEALRSAKQRAAQSPLELEAAADPADPHC